MGSKTTGLAEQQRCAQACTAVSNSQWLYVADTKRSSFTVRVVTHICPYMYAHHGRTLLLQYSSLLEDDKDKYSFGILGTLANTCEKHPDTDKPCGQAWRDKAAIYRQHALSCLKRMGRTIKPTCGICCRALHAEQPTDWKDFGTAVVVYPCGHMQHMQCQLRCGYLEGAGCASCLNP